MPTWLKVLLIIVVALFILFVVAGYIGYRWVQSHAGALRADAQRIAAEAAEFGRGKEPDACVDETFARLSRCDGIICEVKTKIFLTKCVGAANVPQGFCASIPRHNEIIASAQWAVAECARRGHAGDQRCTRVIAGLQDYCEKR